MCVMKQRWHGIWYLVLTLITSVSADRLLLRRESTQNLLLAAEPTRYGVFHAPVVYHFRCNASDAPTYGALHVFYRVLAIPDNDQHWSVQGHVYWEGAGDLGDTMCAGRPKIMSEAKLLVPRSWSEHQCYPRLQIVDEHGNEAASTVSYRPWKITLPVVFRSTVARADAATRQLALAFVFPEGQRWPHTVPITPGVVHAETQESHQPPETKFYTFVRASMNDAHTLQRLMDVHVWWHQLMGFTGTALYMRSHQYARLVQHPAMVSRIHQGSIVPFTFDYIANIEEHNATMQALQHTHLILSFRGRNVWLMSSDVDEMFMTTVPSFDVHTLLSCVQETHPDVEQIHLRRLNMCCEGCDKVADMDAWTPVNISYTDVMARCSWVSTTRRLLPKALINPDTTACWDFHEGISMHQLEERGRPTVSVQNPPEAFQGHWVRMLYIRYTELDLFHSGTTEWQWPLEQRVV